jgi:hypothetical protein
LLGLECEEITFAESLAVGNRHEIVDILASLYGTQHRLIKFRLRALDLIVTGATSVIGKKQKSDIN